MINSKIWLVSATCMLLLTSGCGDDDSGSGSTSDGYSLFDGALAEGGGIITGFGSVVIDGVSYETGNAVMEDLDGADISADSLEVGMRVDFEAKYKESDETGYLSKLFINDQVSGPLHSADVVAKKIYIFGNEILFNDDTVFANFESENLVVELLSGVHVSVSGYRDSTGLLTATLVRKLDPATAKLQIEGKISAKDESDANNKTFVVRGITFKFTEDSEEIINDDNVVKVTFANYTAGTPIPISGIKLVKSETRQYIEDRKLVIRGPIANDKPDDKTFTIGKLLVKYTDDTEYQNGASAQIDDGVMAVVKGTIVVNQTTAANANADANAKALQAREIMFHKVTDQFIEGKITAITTAASGTTITVDGQVFELTRRAQISNKHKTKGKKVLQSLKKDDYVAISYYVTTEASQKNIVTKLKRIDTSGGFEVEALTYKTKMKHLTWPDGTNKITYASVTYLTSEAKFFDQYKEKITASQFKTLHGNNEWDVLLTVVKGASDGEKKVKTLQIVSSLPEDAAFVTKIPTGTSDSDSSYSLNYGKNQTYSIDASTQIFKTFMVQTVAANGSKTSINVAANDQAAFEAIKNARPNNDVFVKVYGSTSSGSFMGTHVLIFVDPTNLTQFAKSMHHSFD